MRMAWAVVVGAACWNAVAFAGRPLLIDDAEPVTRGRFELEAGLAWLDDGHVDHVDLPVGLTYGLIERLEVGAGFGGQWERREDQFGGSDHASSIGDLVLGAKWKVLDQQRFWADQALAASIKLPTADEEEGFGDNQVVIDVMWVVTRQFTDQLAADLNLGLAFLPDRGEEQFSDVVHYGVALRWLMTERLEPVAEVFAETPVDDGDQTAVGITGGIRWLVVDNLVLDAAIGTTVHGEGPDITATVGLTWTF